MDLHQGLLRLITRLNWFFLFSSVVLCCLFTAPSFGRGVFFGGLIVTVNFHLLYRTLKKAFTPGNAVSYNIVLVKYYIRFTITGLIILLLIQQNLVNPLGLFIGLSIVVASIMFATAVGLKKLLFKEAV